MNITPRIYFRIPFRGDVLLNGSILVKSSNISEDGMYVLTDRPFALGSNVTVEFRLGGRGIFTGALVKSFYNSIGLGLRFTGLEEADRDYIRGYVEENYDKADADRKKVIIVEDNDATRRIYKSRLSLDGFIVEEARDGIEALAKIHALHPDIIVLDLYMEKMDGYQVLAYIRGSAALKNMPVIIFSARGTQGEIDRAKLAGASNFFVKMRTSPVKLSEEIKRLITLRTTKKTVLAGTTLEREKESN